MMKSGGLSSPRPLSGQLYKYTNVVKGWQQRWFAVDPETGVLSYYLFDGPGDTVQPGQPARGEAQLAGAVVCPSDEDSRTFSLNCASGDLLKLRAADARARQEWVDGLRAIAELHTKAMGANPPLQPREQLAVHGAMAAARHQLQQTELSDASLARCIESADSPFPHTDPDLLLLKRLLHELLRLLQMPAVAGGRGRLQNLQAVFRNDLPELLDRTLRRAPRKGRIPRTYIDVRL